MIRIFIVIAVVTMSTHVTQYLTKHTEFKYSITVLKNLLSIMRYIFKEHINVMNYNSQ